MPKVDLLLVVDNAASMGEKQRLLSESVPVLINRLIMPNCLDATGNAIGTTGPDGTCTTGTPEFARITDLHLGIVSSSLGAHGGQFCGPGSAAPSPDDRGHLIGAVRGGLASWNDMGFLAWDPAGTANIPPGTSAPAELLADFGDHLAALGQEGCSFAAPLEAWYRFLIDPEPPYSVLNSGNMTTREGVDAELLEQREAFLRSDSLLAIVMLGDRNDCSIVDEGLGWLVGVEQLNNEPFHLPPATSACAADPNDICCQSCAATTTPDGCTPAAEDPACASEALSTEDDAHALRCFDQQRRFGLDVLYPTRRYVDGLTAAAVPNRAGQLVPNPLYQSRNGSPPRDPSLIYLGGIVGVPWHDIATNETREDSRALRFMTAEELLANNRWELMLGSPYDGILPMDPLMVESIEPRTGTHPLTGEPVAAPESADPQAHSINGHEQSVPARDDLQYACIFPLQTPRDCEAAGENPETCECNLDEVERRRPLCEPPGGGEPGSTQYYDKAYPSLRQLQVLKDFGANAIVGSICPKNVEPEGDAASDPYYGYNPAIDALLGRIAEGLSANCFPRQLPVDTDPGSPTAGQISCRVAEAVPGDGSGCVPCPEIPGRVNPSSTLSSLVREILSLTGQCGAQTTPCSNLCVCELQQLTGSELQACQQALVPPEELAGYCYVDAEVDIGNPEIVESCAPTSRRQLRFVGDQTPRPGASTVLTCQ